MICGLRETTGVRQTGEQTAAWDVVAERLEAFVAAWGEGSAPAIDAHLPAGLPALRRLGLVELVKVDVEFRCRDGGQPRIEEYVAAFPELDAVDGPPVELVCEEYHVRKARGEPVELAEFARRFPGRAAEIWRWFGGVERTMTTSLAAAGWDGFRSGETVDDFLVLAEAGKGAFATVYLARQISMGRIVALKVSGDRGDEARTLAQLDHPHIVRVHDQKQLEAAAGRPRMRLIYEQFLPGGTLADVVQRVRRTAPGDRDGRILLDAVRAATAASGLGVAADSPALAAFARLSWPAAVARIGIQLAGALHHAHAAGVLHRDVKPANVLLGAEGSVYLGDFNTSVLASHPAHGPAASFGAASPTCRPSTSRPSTRGTSGRPTTSTVVPTCSRSPCCWANCSPGSGPSATNPSWATWPRPSPRCGPGGGPARSRSTSIPPTATRRRSRHCCGSAWPPTARPVPPRAGNRPTGSRSSAGPGPSACWPSPAAAGGGSPGGDHSRRRWPA
ncbi:MAG: protein kinase domain-containing protein [Planctomycetia bacterium]